MNSLSYQIGQIIGIAEALQFETTDRVKVSQVLFEIAERLIRYENAELIERIDLATKEKDKLHKVGDTKVSKE